MKKMFLTTIITIIFGITTGIVTYSKIININALERDNTLYLLQLGVYEDKISLKEDTKNINNILIIKKNNNYYAYVGISKYKKNLKKICSIYNNLGYNLYLEEKEVDNKNFLSNLKEFDKMLLKSNSEEETLGITSLILSSYEEIVLKTNKK